MIDEAAWQCEQTLHRFFNCLDTGRFDDLVSLVTENGKWIRRGVELQGREAIRKALHERSKSLQTRHLVSNFQFEKVSDSRATSQSVVSVYRSEESPVTQLSSPSIFVFEDTYERVGEKWLIEFQAGKRAFS